MICYRAGDDNDGGTGGKVRALSLNDVFEGATEEGLDTGQHIHNTPALILAGSRGQVYTAAFQLCGNGGV